MLDADLAALYGTNTRSLVQAVKRNLHRFPEDFLFRLTEEEFARLRSQSVISNKTGRGGRRTLPYAFTEHGTVMLASVLNTPTAIQTSVAVVRAFVRLRMILASHAELVRRLNTLEKKNDAQFKAVFDAIRQLMIPVTNKKRPIGYSWKSMQNVFFVPLQIYAICVCSKRDFFAGFSSADSGSR